MTDKQLSLLIGGFLPAILFGVSAIFLKVVNRAGTGMGPFLMGIGLTIFIMGALFACWDRDLAVTNRSIMYLVAFGIMWSLSMASVAIAIKRYNGQISQLVPIYNMNTLVTVVIGLIALAEWRNVHPVKLLVASVLICVGGVLAANA